MAGMRKIPRTRRDKYKELDTVNGVTIGNNNGNHQRRRSSDNSSDELDGVPHYDQENREFMPGYATPTCLPLGNMVLQSEDDDELFVFPAFSRELRPSPPPQLPLDDSSDSPGCDEVDMAVTRANKETTHKLQSKQIEGKYDDKSLPRSEFTQMRVEGHSSYHMPTLNQMLSVESTQSRCSHGRRKLSRSRETNKIVLRCTSCRDEVDYTPMALDYGWFDIICNIISIGSYLADVGSDAWLAYMYYTRHHWWWFGLTLTFIIGPALIMTAFSLKWYVADHKHEKKLKGRSVSYLRWVSRFMFLFFQLAPLMRYIDSLFYGWKAKKIDPKDKLHEKRHWYDLMLYEDTDSSLLRLLECFMEAAPQLVLQLYIMCRIGHRVETYMLIMQSISSLTSLGSLAWALCAYSKALRFSRPEKANMRYRGLALQFLWRFFTIGSRVIALAMFASYFQLWVFLFMGCHWVVMLFWVLWQETKFCDTKWEEFCFNIVAACVHIFCYFNLIEGHTRLRYLFFYTLVYLENVAMILIWYFVSQVDDLWYHMPALLAVTLGFFIGIFFQVIYYLKFHPNNLSSDHSSMRIKICLPLSALQKKPKTMELQMSHTYSLKKEMDVYSVTRQEQPTEYAEVPRQNGGQQQPLQRVSTATSEDSAGTRDSHVPLIKTNCVKIETAV